MDSRGRIRCRDEALRCRSPSRTRPFDGGRSDDPGGSCRGSIWFDHDLALLTAVSYLEICPHRPNSKISRRRRAFCSDQTLSQPRTDGNPTCGPFQPRLPAYAQATSPIRRYGDLVVQRQIAAVLDGLEPVPKKIFKHCWSSSTEPFAKDSIAREDQRHWQQICSNSTRIRAGAPIFCAG